MSEMKKSSTFLKLAGIAGILFVVYNILVFVIAGFTGHGASFWVSYAFMLVAFICVAVSALLLRSSTNQPKDWLFGYPVVKHCTVYIIAELIASVLFMALDKTGFPFAIGFAVQLIILALHLVFLISCFIAKETIDEVEQKVGRSTAFIDLLTVEIAMVADNIDDAAAKKAVKSLEEAVRFSDPISNEMLSVIEAEISGRVTDMRAYAEARDVENVLLECEAVGKLIKERNMKCKVLK